MSGDTIWVTGASTGIGRALAKRLADEGNHVIATARDEAALRALANEHIMIDVVVFDVTRKDQIPLIREQLGELCTHIDRVVLNAGTCEYLDPVSPDWNMMSRVMDVNFFGMINCLDAGWTLLKNAPSPHIVGIGSQAVQAAFPRAEAYGASKAAVRYFLESLRMDVKQYGVDVSIILPGFVDTPLTRKNTFDMPFLMSSDEAARHIARAIKKRLWCYAFPKRLSVMLWFARTFPGLWLKLNADRSAYQAGDLAATTKKDLP